jgi:hypothetical protein
LKNDLESTSSDGPADELIAISVGLVAMYFEVGEETFYSFLESNVMRGKLVAFKVILEVGWLKTMPVYHFLIILLLHLAIKCHENCPLIQT